MNARARDDTYPIERTLTVIHVDVMVTTGPDEASCNLAVLSLSKAWSSMSARVKVDERLRARTFHHSLNHDAKGDGIRRDCFDEGVSIDFWIEGRCFR